MHWMLSLPNATLSDLQKIRQLVSQYPNVNITFSGQLFENQRLIREITIVGLMTMTTIASLYFVPALYLWTYRKGSTAEVE